MSEPVPVLLVEPPRHDDHATAPERLAALKAITDRMRPIFDHGWGMEGARKPRVEVEETDRDYVFAATLPGARRDDVLVVIRDQDLCISGKLRPRNRFAYRSTLPFGFDYSRIEAKLDRGVLTVRVGKLAYL
ncbi:Hsp20/alpha crystallin family protein [Amycolatopsis sp. K13G38]|uniref:Hsp20/alpha crystallin family protein n=1 Tax=Amycolatopsis acididurans TaxID=2724524 RepID=A0ABX1IXV9_9PSEU|nr:Hsp20/alpha crystallin family protein [Amycolatopsis acididurans]NKQ52154.1 Hsp20/alpha crystallin family protein [Amycolatopsis acididurans]